VRTGIPRARWYCSACAVLTKSSGSTGGFARTPDLRKGGVCLSVLRFSWVGGFGVQCVIRVFCVKEGSMLLQDQYLGTQFP
jgi:hypothetical protein